MNVTSSGRRPELCELSNAVRAEIAKAPPASADAAAAVQARVDDILRPPGALRRLDELAVHLAGWQHTDHPQVVSPQIIVFAGDHGVTAEGVSAFPAEVTASMVTAFGRGVATISVLAAAAGAGLEVVDVGVGEPTGNLRIEAAMDPEWFAAAFSAGRNAVAALPAETDLLVLGEMGIGNTTAAAATCAALDASNRRLGSATVGGVGEESVDAFVGTGTGIGDEARAVKRAVVHDAVVRVSQVDDPLEILREVGGTELAAMAGAMVEARIRSVPVLLDGYIVGAAALAVHTLAAEITAPMIAAHRSAEPGHRYVLEQLGLEPLLDLDLRLGEASGAAAAIPLVAMACRVVTEVATFGEFFADGGDGDSAGV